MRLRPLPNTDTLVSEICLGTMMFGDQVNKNNAFQQLDIATKELGINFIVRCYWLQLLHSELGHFSLFRILLKYILRQAHQVLQETQKKLLESG